MYIKNYDENYKKVFVSLHGRAVTYISTRNLFQNNGSKGYDSLNKTTEILVTLVLMSIMFLI